MRICLVAFTVVMCISCKSRTDEIDLVQYKDGEQLLTMNDVERNGEKFIAPRILRLSKDSVLAGDEMLIKIFLERDNLKLVDAFLDCKPITSPTVDTMSYKISGCSKGLIVQNDTIFIGFRPTKSGVQKFSEITILTKDRERIFRTFKYSFEYKVIAR